MMWPLIGTTIAAAIIGLCVWLNRGRGVRGMSADKTVWVISKGEYSDYRVICAVASEEDAVRLAARYNGRASHSYYETARVEELPMVDSHVEQVEVLTLKAEVWDNGTTSSPRTDVRVEWPFDALYGAPELSWRWVRAPVHKGEGGRLGVWGTDHERVRKVFGERRALLLTDDAFRSQQEATS